MIKSLRNNYRSLSLALRNYKEIILTLIVVGVISDILLFSQSSDLRIFPILSVYIVSISAYKLSSKITFLFCLLLLMIMYISFLLSNASVTTEKAAVWLVLFLIVGIIQQWNE